MKKFGGWYMHVSLFLLTQFIFISIILMRQCMKKQVFTLITIQLWGSGKPLPTLNKSAKLIYLKFLLDEGVHTPSARKKLTFYFKLPPVNFFLHIDN